MQERDNLLRIFKETKNAVSEGNPGKVKLLSNQTTNTAALTHDPDNIAAAVIVYSLSKILERGDYKNLPGWKKFYDVYINAIDNIITALEKNDDKLYRQNVETIQKSMNNVSGKLKDYVQDTLRKAKINKASKIHEHGISMERTASLLGITMYELANYIGRRDFDNQELDLSKEVKIKTRVKTAMEMFS